MSGNDRRTQSRVVRSLSWRSVHRHAVQAAFGGRRFKATLVLACCLCALLAAVVVSQGGYEMVQYVIGGGGGRVQTAPYVLDGTLGQAAVGPRYSAPYELCSGMWCEGAVYTNHIYLPAVLRGH